MKNFRNVVLYAMIPIFLLTLLLPNVTYPFMKNHIDANCNENRKLAKFPSLNPTKVCSFPAGFEHYYNDHLPYKKQFVQAFTSANVHLFGTLSSDSVLLGKKSWLFYKSTDDGDSLECYSRTNCFTQGQLTQYRDLLIKSENVLKKRGKKLFLLIIPDKEQVYSEYMPDNVPVKKVATRQEQFEQYISNQTDIPIVSPRKELLQYKSKYPLYYKNDTHWNNLGAFIGFSELLKATTGTRKSLDRAAVVTTPGKRTGDLAKMANVQNIFQQDQSYTIKNYQPDVKITEHQEENGAIIKCKSTSNNPQKILLAGDSFRENMTTYIEKSYSQSYILHKRCFDSRLLKESDADIVVLECVERYLPQMFSMCNTILNTYSD